ncbi:MAG: phosphotransferase family protein [Ardenticatenaceae bacterium]|nr:phosphotransferase family protein [Ardenticatenaceae bacterium]
MLSENSPDTIDVRSDERLDEQSLRNYLASHGDVLNVETNQFEVRQFGGGMANLTYELYFPDDQRRFVLRRPPLGPVAASAHDMGREFKVLSRLFQRFPLAPRAFLYCDDAEVIGAPFFIMERRFGIVVRKKMPADFLHKADAAQQMSLALVDALADFHAVDYQAIGLGNLGKPQGFVTRQIEGWMRRWRKARLENDPADSSMHTVYEWLKGNQPDEKFYSLVHNDYKLDNVMFDREDPARMVAIFDWDMCTLGDPLCDLGALLTYWTDDDDPPYMKMLSATFMPVGQARFISRRELVERYALRSGRDVSQIAFYHGLGLFRLTVIIAQIYIRYVRGQTKDQRFAALGEMIPLLARAAVDITG